MFHCASYSVATSGSYQNKIIWNLPEKRNCKLLSKQGIHVTPYSTWWHPHDGEAEKRDRNMTHADTGINWPVMAVSTRVHLSHQIFNILTYSEKNRVLSLVLYLKRNVWWTIWNLWILSNVLTWYVNSCCYRKKKKGQSSALVSYDSELTE